MENVLEIGITKHSAQHSPVVFSIFLSNIFFLSFVKSNKVEIHFNTLSKLANTITQHDHLYENWKIQNHYCNQKTFYPVKVQKSSCTNTATFLHEYIDVMSYQYTWRALY